MRKSLLAILACPGCKGELSCQLSRGSDDAIEEGTLECASCARAFPIIKSIPRFVAPEHYAESFGYQWNTFRLEQIDSANGKRLSRDRFYAETAWTDEWMNGKWLLDAGCGAGRFLDVARSTRAEVVGIDMSDSVDAALQTLAGAENVHLVQASIFELPFRPGSFDGCYCIGVIQHTPDPPRALACLAEVLKTAGRIAVTIYERKPWTKLNMKYLIRPMTRRMEKRTLLNLIRGSMPILFPVTEVLFRIPVLNRVFMFAIPVANYVKEPSLTLRDRYRWAIMDTFDMLSPAFDDPKTYEEVGRALSAARIHDLRRLPNGGVNVVGVRG
jgi:SAM-dependent methyltransferase